MCHACPPAKELGNKLEEQGLVKVEQIDVSEPNGLEQARKYGVMSTPHLVLVNGEKIIKEWVGAPDKEEIIENLKSS